MLITLFKATLPPGERRLVELVHSALQSPAVAKVAPAISVSSLLSQLRGDVPPSGMLDTIGRAVRQFSANPAMFHTGLGYLLSLAEKNGVTKDDVLGLATRLAKDLTLSPPEGEDITSKVGSVLVQVADRLKDPLAPVLGGVCSCPKCSFTFSI